jgi:lantibiotic modifying enzyme
VTTSLSLTDLAHQLTPHPDPRRQLEASLTRLVTEHPPASIRPGGGLFKGPVSVAYTFLVLQQIYEDLIIEGHALGTWSAAYLKHAQDNISTYAGPQVGKCGITDDILALLAIGAASSKDADMVANLCDYSAEAIDPETENELLFGRAGYLYLLRLVKASFMDDPKTLQLITDTQEDVIDAILDSPRPWKWHGKTYIGAVHGAIGIITQVVLTNPTKYAEKLQAELAVLLTYQYEGGNFPASVPPEKDRLVQVCHGAPGVVCSLVSIQEFFTGPLREKIEKAVVKGRECVLERGLLTKEPCLCHGKIGIVRMRKPCCSHTC